MAWPRAVVALLVLAAAGAAAVPSGLSDPPVGHARRRLPRRVAAQQPAGAATSQVSLAAANATAAQPQQQAAANTTAAAQPQQSTDGGAAAQPQQQVVPATAEAWRPSVDCWEMENCRRCRRYQGCTSCLEGYTLSKMDNGLNECVAATGTPSSPPTVTSPPAQPASPPPTEQPASSPPPAGGNGGNGTPQPPGNTPRQCGMQLHNVDLWGADLADMAARSFADCCAACTAWPGCGSFTFAPSQSRCYLKAAAGWELKRANGMTSAIMEGGSSSSGGGSGGSGAGAVSPQLVPSPSPPPAVPSPSPSPRPSPSPSPRPSPSPSPRPSPSPSPSPAPQNPVKQPPGAGSTVPRINLGRLNDGSEPRVLQTLGSSRSTYHYYTPSYQVSTTYCADAFAGKSREWLMSYPWVAYCAPYMGGMSQANCGKCLRMTNNRTGTKVVVRIVDMCGHGAIDADYQSAFIPLDTDKAGYAAGSMTVGLELVAC